MRTTSRSHPLAFGLMLWLLLALVACTGDSGTPAATTVSQQTAPANAIEISIIYAPEYREPMEQIIPQFNDAYRNGINPLTGERLASGERPIFVNGRDGSSGVVMQGIVNALISPSNANVERPTIFSPSVSHWLALANHLASREIFTLADSPATGLAPVVMAIWESRLNAIRETVGYDDVGWEELLMVLNSPNGWEDFGIVGGRKTVYYGHTDPFISSTALSTLIAEFYAAARADGFDGRLLTLDVVRDEQVREGVRRIEQLIRHYSRRTTEFRNYIAQGPSYLDFVALEENDLIAINRGLTDFQPPEKLVALYPKEGTFWHEHPFGIVNASWVTAEQADAARVFTQYVLLPEQQQVLMAAGFRPANPDVPLGFPFEEQYGIALEGPRTVLDVPDPDVIAAIQESWTFVKKQADIVILLDVSGSMASEDKIGQAINAGISFVDNMQDNNRVGLTIFNDTVRTVVPVDNLETNVVNLRRAISNQVAAGGTSLYDALYQVVDEMRDPEGQVDRIRAVILLSDGEDRNSTRHSLDDVLRLLESTREDRNPVLVIPVAYGSLADVRVLSRIAAASNTTLQSGDASSIINLLELISSYF